MRRALGLLSCLFVLLMASGCDWPQFLSGPEHTSFNSSESTISTTNVSTLVQRFTAPTGASLVGSEPVVAGGVAYVVSGNGLLYAFSAGGTTSCTGTPTVCAPLWTANVGGESSEESPAVVGGVVYVASSDGTFYAFDAAGKTNCAGTPTVCTPLWTANLNLDLNTAPVVANGMVYLSTSTGTVALDAAGQVDCSGTPKMCSPLWEASSRGYITVANGIVYVVGNSLIDAYDAAGNTDCTASGSASSPKTCSPLREYQPNLPLGQTVFAIDYAVVSGSTLYVDAAAPFTPLGPPENFEAFDATGVENCTAATVLSVCTPLWTTSQVTGSFPPAAVANGYEYVGGAEGLSVFDATGTTNCTASTSGPGSPKVCSPLWTSSVQEAIDQPMAVANGLLFGTDGGTLYALDANGKDNCSGGVCSPLWRVSLSGIGLVYSGPVVANGLVYASVGNELVAYGLPS
jgi:outer membrane protein assembly factor BamB